jgi:hypothetical protein
VVPARIREREVVHAGPDDPARRVSHPRATLTR